MNQKNEGNMFTTKSCVSVQIYLFTTERYVSIQTPNVHLQEVCVNQNTIFSSPRVMCQSNHHLFISKKYAPIRNWNNMRPHIIYTISTCFLFEFNLSKLLCIGSFLLLEESKCILPPSPRELLSSIFSL